MSKLRVIFFLVFLILLIIGTVVVAIYEGFMSALNCLFIGLIIGYLIFFFGRRLVMIREVQQTVINQKKR